MGVDNRRIAVVVGLGIVLLFGLLVLFISQKNIAGQATLTGIFEPSACDNGQPCQQGGYICSIVSDDTEGICVPSDRNLDTDSDGLKDYDEVVFYGTNPLEENSDSDDLPDSREVIVYEAGQYIDDDAGLVTQLTDSFRRLFEID